MAKEKKIDVLRAEIDDLDKEIHDLLIKRFEVTKEIGEIKGEDAFYFRPAREARLLRALVRRHTGPVPPAVLVRIWREILTCSTRLQGSFSVTVFTSKARNLSRLAIDYFSTQTPQKNTTSTKVVIRDVISQGASIGILPLPGALEDDDWWLLLAGVIRQNHCNISGEGKAAHVIGRLPFLLPQQTTGQRQEEAVVVSSILPEPTGDDNSYLVLDIDEGLSRSTLRRIMQETDIEIIDILGDSKQDGRYYVLLEVEGFVVGDDCRLQGLCGKSEGRIDQAWPIGSYACPIKSNT